MRSQSTLRRQEKSSLRCKSQLLASLITFWSSQVSASSSLPTRLWPPISKSQLQARLAQLLRRIMQTKNFKDASKWSHRSAASFKVESRSAIKWARNSSIWSRPFTTCKETRIRWFRRLSKQVWIPIPYTSVEFLLCQPLNRGNSALAMADPTNSKTTTSLHAVTMPAEETKLTEATWASKTLSGMLPTSILHQANNSWWTLEWVSKRKAPQTNRSISTVDRTQIAHPWVANNSSSTPNSISRTSKCIYFCSNSRWTDCEN